MNGNYSSNQSAPGVYSVPAHRVTSSPVVVQPLDVPMGLEPNAVTGKWRDHLCCCFSQCAPSCLMSFFCPCIMLGQMCQRMQLSSCTMVFTCFVALYIFLAIMTSVSGVPVEAVFFIILGIATCILRGRIRERYQIEGNACLDCLQSIFCLYCTLSQAARHIYGYTESCDGCDCSAEGTNTVRRVAPVAPPPTTSAWINSPTSAAVFTQPYRDPVPYSEPQNNFTYTNTASGPPPSYITAPNSVASLYMQRTGPPTQYGYAATSAHSIPSTIQAYPQPAYAVPINNGNSSPPVIVATAHVV